MEFSIKANIHASSSFQIVKQNFVKFSVFEMQFGQITLILSATFLLCSYFSVPLNCMFQFILVLKDSDSDSIVCDSDSDSSNSELGLDSDSA